MDTTITIDQLRDKLIPLDQAVSRLEKSEPLVETEFVTGPGKVHFKLEPGWNYASDVAGPVDARVSIGDTEVQLTRDSLLEATSACGIPKGYALRTPASLIEPQLNYWFGGGFDSKEYKILSANGIALALTKQSIKSFSNVRLVEQAVDGIYQQYGSDTEILVDYKFPHNVERTHIRLIVPEHSRTITNTGTDNDTWSAGIQVRNSLMGTEKTSIDGYLFRFWCSNGAIDTHSSSGVWSRRSGQGDEVYEWARTAVDSILGGLEGSFDAVQKLTEVGVNDDAPTILRDVFDQYRLPASAREAVLSQIFEADQLSMYTVMQAITRVANDGALPANNAERLMRVGGDLVHTASSRCEACHRLQLS